MSNLKNIKAVKEILQGNHKTQTRKIFGFSDIESAKEKNKKREIGEIWEEKIGDKVYWWEQLENIKVRYNVHPDIAKSMQEIRESSKKFSKCPKDICTCTSPTHLDEKFRNLTGMCSDCTISYETSLKINNKYRDYELDKMRNNAESFFREADKEVSVLKESLKSVEFVEGANGNTEKWSVENINQMLNNIDESYDNFKKITLNKYIKDKID